MVRGIKNFAIKQNGKPLIGHASSNQKNMGRYGMTIACTKSIWTEVNE
ncbi:hypothetical protein [Lysinibacillus sp. Y5S-8]